MRMASSTRARISTGGTPRFSSAKATSSSTTVATIWLSGFWNTIPTFWRISNSLSSSAVEMPSTVTVPAAGSKMALKCLASVDLPQPFAPSTATYSPRRTPSDSPSTAGLPSSV